MRKVPPIHANTVSPHPSELDIASLLRVGRTHATAAQMAGQPRLAALLKELCERLEALYPGVVAEFRQRRLPAYLASPEALHRHITASRPGRTLRSRRPAGD